MALFDSTIQTGAQAQQLGFAPPTTPANSFTAPSVPLGYGQMQGQPLSQETLITVFLQALHHYLVVPTRWAHLKREHF